MGQQGPVRPAYRLLHQRLQHPIGTGLLAQQLADQGNAEPGTRGVQQQAGIGEIQPLVLLADIDVGQQDQGLNFSDPGLLLDAACAGLGIALVSQLLSEQARATGLLQPLVEQTVRGPNWALLTHRDSEESARCFSEWLLEHLPLKTR